MEMKARLKKKLAKRNVSNDVTKEDAIQACETILNYMEHVGFRSAPTDNNYMSLRAIDINIFNGTSIAITTTCSDLNEVLEPVLRYERGNK